MNEKNIDRKWIGLSLLMVSLITGALLTGHIRNINIDKEPYNIVYGEPKEGKPTSIGAILKIEHYDSNGELKGTVIKHNDLFLRNFAVLLQTITLGSDSEWSGNLKDSAPLISDNDFIENGNVQVFRGRINIGDSSTSVSLTDNSLGNELYSTPPSSVQYSESGNKMNITATAVEGMTGTQDIYEFGLYVRQMDDDSNYDDDHGWGEFQLIKDVLESPISVSDGDTLAVTYIVQMN